MSQAGAQKVGSRQVDALVRELDGEARTTRRHLERLPDERLGWKPHEKSYTLGGLGCHLVDCIAWTERIFTGGGVDVDPATFPTCRAASVAELLAELDAVVARSREALAAASDEALLEPWRLELKGRLLFERPKGPVFRDFVLKHLIHHRGQLTVYLRLLDVPLAPTYGPTADEAF
jgi:uncharacterized damage-inducible protein DinB